MSPHKYPVYGYKREALAESLARIERVLSPTDSSKFSADDERNRIATARVLIAKALELL